MVLSGTTYLENGIQCPNAACQATFTWPTERQGGDWLYYADAESWKTGMNAPMPPIRENAQRQDSEVKWEPVVRVYSQGTRGKGDAIPYELERWPHASEVICPHCNKQHFYRSVLPVAGKAHCEACGKPFSWPLVAYDGGVVIGDPIDEGVKPEDATWQALGEADMVSQEDTDRMDEVCAHMIQAHTALQQLCIQVNSAIDSADLAIYCWRCNRYTGLEGPLGMANMLEYKSSSLSKD